MQVRVPCSLARQPWGCAREQQVRGWAARSGTPERLPSLPHPSPPPSAQDSQACPRAPQESLCYSQGVTPSRSVPRIPHQRSGEAVSSRVVTAARAGSDGGFSVFCFFLFFSSCIRLNVCEILKRFLSWLSRTPSRCLYGVLFVSANIPGRRWGGLWSLQVTLTVIRGPCALSVLHG